MEFIFVAFDPTDPRDVIANGNVIGKTDAELTLPTNFYEITLSGEDYEPDEWEGNVSGTLPTDPLRIIFTKKKIAGG